MGGCSAPNCSNSTSMGKQLFRFPKDPARKMKWVVNCRRDFDPTPHSRLCQDHFEKSQFEEIARSPTGGMKLKPNAIPTLFSVGDPPYPAITTPFILLPLKPEPGKAFTCIYQVSIQPNSLYYVFSGEGPECGGPWLCKTQPTARNGG